MGATVVLRRRFDPEECLRVVEAERCEAMAVIPVMLQRIVNLPQEVKDSSTSPGSRWSPPPARPCRATSRWSGWTSSATTSTTSTGPPRSPTRRSPTPTDLREAPGSAGRPPYATVVKILDEHGRPVPDGEPGRIFVGNKMLFEGYTGGGNKEVVDGLMSTGDVGRFGRDGRLYVEGRDDEMIVSGGENVFPAEVEDCLARHAGSWRRPRSAWTTPTTASGCEPSSWSPHAEA